MHDASDEMAFNKLVGRRIRDYRTQKGWSQRQLAAALVDLKLDPSAITRIERGDRSIKLREASAIAEALDVGLYYLVTKHDDLRRGQLYEFADTARDAIDAGRQALFKAAISYALVVDLIHDYPSIGVESKKFLAGQSAEVANERPLGVLHIDVEHHALILEIIHSATTNLVGRVDPGETDGAEA